MDAQAVQLRKLVEQALEAPNSQARQRARAQIDRLFASYEARIYRVCWRYLGDRERAREMTQDVLMTGYRRLGEYRGEGSFHSFLYGIARFKCMRAIEKRRDYVTADGILDDVADDAIGPVTGLRRHERLAVLRDAAAAVLDEQEQEAIHLRYERGLSMNDVGRILGVEGRSGGKGLLQRCRNKLRRELLRRKGELGLDTSFFVATR